MLFLLLVVQVLVNNNSIEKHGLCQCENVAGWILQITRTNIDPV